jgi:predicted DNA-binding transcriptional regulator AlpA
METDMPRKDPKPAVKPDQLDDHKLLTEKRVAELTGMPRRQRLKLEKRDEFPQPIRVSQKILLYPSRKILAWIAARERSAVQ